MKALASLFALGLAATTLTATPALARLPAQAPARIALDTSNPAYLDRQLNRALRSLCERPHIASVKAMSLWANCIDANREAVNEALAQAGGLIPAR